MSLLFLEKFIRNPKQIGSIIPSSRFLAGTMVQAVPWDRVRAAAELGAGTGAVTSFIASSAPKSAQVFLFEKDEQMRNDLIKKYPGFSCHSDALKLTEVIRNHGVDRLDGIISGLPFFNFDRDFREALVDQIAAALRPGGYFVAFQYSLQMKSHFERRFEIEKVQFVPWNIPPAFVYVCRPKGETGK